MTLLLAEKCSIFPLHSFFSQGNAHECYSLINSEYEFVALHRDIGETELKQGREIRAGGNLVYVDSAAVRAVKHGRVLIIEGIEKAERGIMPVSALDSPLLIPN